MQMSRKKVNLGIIVPFMLLLISIFAFPKNVEAKNTYANEVEPNDTRLQAQEIQENKSTPEGLYNSAIGEIYQMNGSTSATDEDWFRVYLTKGLKYFTCGEKAFDYHVEDEAGNIVKEGAYNEAEGVFSFEIPADGTYYVRIKGITSETTKYFFYVGSPVWGVGSAVMTCSPTTINMTGGSKTGIFDSTNLNLPKDAIVNSLNFDNVRTTSVSSITMTHNQSGLKLKMRTYIWAADDLVSQHIPAASMWTATFGYEKTTSFNPTVKMYYAYPKYQ